jgi:hypothetical protein
MGFDPQHPLMFLQSSLSYKITDIDDSADPSYYGFVEKDGRWFIMQRTDATGSYRYMAGSSDYATNWGNRAILAYDYYNNAGIL